MVAIRSASEQISDWANIRHITRFTTCFTPSRGDGWQIVVRPPALALRAALFIRAVLRRGGKERATRIFIATGEAEIPNDGNLNRAAGPVFVASGRGLDELPRWAEMGHAEGGAIAAATRLADHISQDWTPAQAQVMEYMLLPFETTQAEAAKRLGKTQQAVQQSLSSAGYHAVDDALALIEAR